MIQISENEIRDIVDYLKAGKPLPSEYRFRLFENTKQEVELIWNGKNQDLCNIVFPFQTIEQVDEPRSEKNIKKDQLTLFDKQSGRQIAGWSNKLIWGDNKFILSSLKNGPLRREIEKQGGIKLIYIDPPFDVGADFSMNIEIGDNKFTKKPSVLEEIAYRDTWGQGADSFISMIYERLILMRDLLADDGSIYVHCDWRVSGYIRLILDEVFGKENFKNHIIWGYRTGGIPEGQKFAKKHDDILFYGCAQNQIFNRLKQKSYTPTVPEPHTNSGKRLEVHRDEHGKYRMVEMRDVWDDIDSIFRNDKQIVGYPTQKPEALLARIIQASSNEGDLVCDFFCGSGTTLAVAEKLGRKWIGSDLGKFAIHTTRKRMISVQRQLKEEGRDYRAFEILNLGKYERQHYVGININPSEKIKQKELEKKEKDFRKLILEAYKAEAINGFKTFHGKKSHRIVVIGPVNLPVTRRYVEEILKECLLNSINKVDLLGFEFEMGLFPNIRDEASERGVDICPKYIPREVFDKRAINKGQVRFYDVAYIEVKPIIRGKNIAIELCDFSVYYNQDDAEETEKTLKNNSSKLLIENGQIIKISKDKNSELTREVLTETWTDWIDYWSVDFDYESKKEIIYEQDYDGNIDESWTGDYVFENEWQSFRTKQNRELELISCFAEGKKKKNKIAIKVVDIFGNDTMKVIEVQL